MGHFILDTGILVGYLRGASFAKFVEEKYEVSKTPNVAVISVVSVGELYALAFRNEWGPKRLYKLAELMKIIVPVDIGDPNILERYGEIDVYSQGRHSSKKLPKGIGPRNMGKNDIWIAATGSVLKAILLTTDSDFDHLNKVFLDVVYVDQNQGKT